MDAQKFRGRYVCGTITVVLAFAILCRTAYIFLNEAEFKDYPGKKRLDWRFPFTQIRLINNAMLFWSLGIIFVFLVAQFAMGLGMGRIKEYIGDVCMRWLLAYGFFLIFYYSFCVLSGTTEADFDPSGHFACSLVAQANHASYYLFIAK